MNTCFNSLLHKFIYKKMKDFVVSLDVSALEKYESESEPYNLLVDTRKMNTVEDFIFWFKHLFSINDPVVLLHDEAQVNVEEKIQVLSSKNKLIVKPSGSVNDSKTTAELPLVQEKTETITETPVIPAKEENTTSDLEKPENVSAVAPQSDKKRDTSEAKINKVTNSKNSRDRFVFISCGLYENGKLRNIVEEIDVGDPSSYPIIESKDMFYRCYSKSLKSIEKHNVLPLACDNWTIFKKKPVNEVQSSSDKKVSEVSGESSNGSPKSKDKNKFKHRKKYKQNSLSPKNPTNHESESHESEK